jgi:transposase
MEVFHARCAGLDVHKETVVASVRMAEGSKVSRQTRTFATTTGALLELRDWLESHAVTHVAMEATGVYWKPVWHVLDGGADLVLANRAHIKNVPGRKTDVADAEWIADLLAHGLIRGSFVPPERIGEMRDLTRTRKQMVRERARHVQRIQKVLEDANVKLVERLQTIPGVSELTARTIVAEIGTEMARFPTAEHLVSWAGLSPQRDESAGKRRSSRTRKGGWLKTALVQSAWTVVRTREGHLYSKFLRIKARRGGKKAVVAVASSLLTAAYYMIQRGTTFEDLGADYLSRRTRADRAQHLVRRLRHLAYEVELRTAA